MKTRRDYHKQEQRKSRGIGDRIAKIVKRVTSQPFQLPRDPFEVEIKGRLRGVKVG